MTPQEYKQFLDWKIEEFFLLTNELGEYLNTDPIMDKIDMHIYMQQTYYVGTIEYILQQRILEICPSSNIEALHFKTKIKRYTDTQGVILEKISQIDYPDCKFRNTGYLIDGTDENEYIIELPLTDCMEPICVSNSGDAVFQLADMELQRTAYYKASDLGKFMDLDLPAKYVDWNEGDLMILKLSLQTM